MQNRRKDLIEVFDSQWKANQFDASKEKEKRSDFNNRMFGTGEIKENKPQRQKTDYIQKDLNRLENNMNREYSIYKANKVNSFFNKYKDK